jgi:hypothetical protein
VRLSSPWRDGIDKTKHSKELDYKLQKAAMTREMLVTFIVSGFPILWIAVFTYSLRYVCKFFVPLNREQSQKLWFRLCLSVTIVVLPYLWCYPPDSSAGRAWAELLLRWMNAIFH